MSEKSPGQPMPESENNKEAWLKELNSKKTRDLILGYIINMKMGFSTEDAEDVVQQVMLKGARAVEAGQFKGNSKLTTWLCSIARNEGLMLIRKQNSLRLNKMTDLSDAYELASDDPTSEESYITVETAKNLRSHFDKLSPKARQVMELFAEGFNAKQIADHLGADIGKIKAQYYRARESLKKIKEESDKKKVIA